MRRAELRNVAGQTQPLDSLAGERVAAFCGIGNPAAFRRTLEELGVRDRRLARVSGSSSRTARATAPNWRQRSPRANAELVVVHAQRTW